MFFRCKIEIASGATKTEITLLPFVGGMQTEGVIYWGPYKSDTGNIPPARKRWIYSLGAFELRLVDAGGDQVGEVGGGLDYHEIAPMEPFAILSQAFFTTRGIEPMYRNASAAGRLESGFNLDVAFNQGPVTWRLAAYKREGATAWSIP